MHTVDLYLHLTHKLVPIKAQTPWKPHTGNPCSLIKDENGIDSTGTGQEKSHFYKLLP